MGTLYNLLTKILFFLTPPGSFNAFFQMNNDYWVSGGGYTSFLFATLITSLVVAIFYYYILNGSHFPAEFYYKRTWFSFWMFTAFASSMVSLLMFYTIIPETYNEQVLEGLEPWGGTCWAMMLANALLSIVAFLLISLIIKQGSTNAQRTPW